MKRVTLGLQDGLQRRLLMKTSLPLAFMTLLAACGGEGVSPPSVSTATVFSSPSSSPSSGTPPRRGLSLGLGKYLAGRVAQAESDSSAAAAYYVSALAADPSNVLIARRAYFYLLAEGEVRPGMALAARVMELDPSSTIAPLVLAVHKAHRNDYAGAVASLKNVSQEGFNSFVVPLLRAWALAGSKDWDGAMAALKPMETQPQFSQLYTFHGGLIMELAGRNDEAEALYQATLDNAHFPSLRTTKVISSFLYRHGREDAALALISLYREQNPNVPLGDVVLKGGVLEGDASERATGKHSAFAAPIPSARAGMAEALYSAATSVLQKRAVDTATVFCRLSLLLDPDFPYPKLMIANVMEIQGRPREALTLYQATPAESPIYFTARLRMAQILETLDQGGEADAVLADLAKRYPERVEPLISRGDLARERKDWNKAAAYYQGALQRFPSLDQSPWNLYYALGVSLERAKRWPEAQEALQTALRLNPTQPHVLNYLGYSWIDRKINLEEGKALIEKALALDPTDGYIIDSLGWAYYLSGDYGRAVRELERAVENEPADPTINEHLGDAYWRVGRTTEAKFQWHRALTLDPEQERIKIIKEKLKQGLPPPPNTITPQALRGAVAPADRDVVAG